MAAGLKERLTKDRQYGLYTANAMLPDILSKNSALDPLLETARPMAGPNRTTGGGATSITGTRPLMNPDMLRRIGPVPV